MDPVEKQPAVTHVRVLLTEEELQLPAIDDLINKYFDWQKLSKEAAGGRKTRSANRRSDTVYDEIINFKLPPIKIRLNSSSPPPSIRSLVQGHSNNNSTKSSTDCDSESSSVVSAGRTLRPRCRTPSVSRQQQTSPSTPNHQSIRAHMRKNLDSVNSNVLSAALEAKHPSVSVVKLRQLMRADSAQKKREEEKERQERVRIERKAKEERAEAQKRQLLEERAITAKMKREQRLLHAAEVRKARELARVERKLKEDQVKKLHNNHNHVNETYDNNSRSEMNMNQEPIKTKDRQPTNEASETTNLDEDTGIVKQPTQATIQQEKPVEHAQTQSKTHKQQLVIQKKMDETFQKLAEEVNNIDISLHDETTDYQKTNKVEPIAAWARAPGLRDAIVAQYSKPGEELLQEALRIFRGVQLPVDLQEIFKDQAVHNRYLRRTSSAVWTPPHKPLKRTSSIVNTPTEPKRSAKS